MSRETYTVNEVFLSVQGEGVRKGTVNVFVRLAGCNLRCSADGEAGFDCDTEFTSGTPMTLNKLWETISKTCDDMGCPIPTWMVITGGEPALQIDEAFCDFFHAKFRRLAVETNGTYELPYRGTADKDSLLADKLSKYLVDWICVSPKSAEHTLKQLVAHEVKYVRNLTQTIPKTRVQAQHYLISPAFDALSVGGSVRVDPHVMRHCIRLCLANPTWRLSVQEHKTWLVR